MKLTTFRVTNFRNVHDSGPIHVSNLTALVGQNESGKSNLCEALEKLNPADPNAKYDFNEDWPADKWGNKDPDAVVCSADFAEDDPAVIADLMAKAGKEEEKGAPPQKFVVRAQRDYKDRFSCAFDKD